MNPTTSATPRPAAPTRTAPRKSRYQKLMEDVIQSGVKTAGPCSSRPPRSTPCAISATKSPSSPAATIRPMPHHPRSTSPDPAQPRPPSHLPNWAKLPAEQRKTDDLLEKLGSDFFRLLDGLTIARARKHIMRYYSSEMSCLGGFPERLKPITLFFGHRYRRAVPLLRCNQRQDRRLHPRRSSAPRPLLNRRF